MKQNPDILKKLIIQKPYWSKKLDSEFPDTYLFEEPDYSNSDTGHAFIKSIKLSSILFNRTTKNKQNFNPFFEYDDLYEALNAHDFIIYFSLKNKIHPAEIIQYTIFWHLHILGMLYKAFSKQDDLFQKIPFFAIRKIKKFEKLQNIQLNHLDYQKDIIEQLQSFDLRKFEDEKYFQKAYEKAFETASENFALIEKTHNELTINPLNYNQQAIVKIFDYTMRQVRDEIQSKKVEIGQISVDKFDTFKKSSFKHILDDLEQYNTLVKSKLQNKRVFNYALKHQEHFIHNLLEDRIGFLVDHKQREVTPIFEATYKATLIGFYEKGLLLNAKKSQVIIELHEIKTALNKIKGQDHLIKQVDELIEFFKQDKRYEKYIPFKALRKYTGMTKAQVKSLIKAVFIDKSYVKTYDSIEENIKIITL